MPTGRLQISRGQGSEAPPAAGPRLRLVRAAPPEAPGRKATAAAAAPPPPPPASPDYHLVHDRLTALERLARLHAEGCLDGEEFAAEKAAILALPADELVLRHPAAPAAPGAAPAAAPDRAPPLAGRLLGWRLLPFGLLAGLGLSVWAQPRETLAFADQALRWLGA
jgi:hypothetical protein